MQRVRSDQLPGEIHTRERANHADVHPERVKDLTTSCGNRLEKRDRKDLEEVGATAYLHFQVPVSSRSLVREVQRLLQRLLPHQLEIPQDGLIHQAARGTQASGLSQENRLIPVISLQFQMWSLPLF